MLEQTFKALADENRLRILNLLLHGEFCVCELEVFLGLSQSNLSRHLGKLKTAEIITAKKEGQWVHYLISEDFKEKNKKLFEYLYEKLNEDQAIKQDVERMKNYQKSKLTCSVIRENKEHVLEIIDPDCSCRK